MKLRGAISGFGAVAELAHLPGWSTRPAVELNAVHEPVAERRHAAINLIRNVRVYDDLDLMLSGEKPDFLDIASPPAHHGATARAALDAGVHVLVEKPLCLSLDEFDQLAALASARARILMCVHNWKYAPPYAAARRAIEAGRLGTIRYIALDRLRTQPAGAGHTGGAWRSSAASGGGILIDHGWHIFYLMHWLLGGAAPVSISAHLGSPSNGGAEDLADLRIDFSGGALARAHLSWQAPVRRTSALIYGQDAALEIEGDRVVLTSRSGGKEDLSVADIADDSYHAAWFGAVAAEFERAIAGASEIARRNLAEARAALMLITGARESALRGGHVIEIGA
jgi:predicted dehydrogenase